MKVSTTQDELAVEQEKQDSNPDLVALVESAIFALYYSVC